MFDGATPEHFFRSTSAVHEHRLRQLPWVLMLHSGRPGFGLFVRNQRARCRRQLAAMRDVAVAGVLVNEDVVRRFVGEGDEYSPDFAARLRREATDMDAELGFVVMMTPVTSTTSDVAADVAGIDDAIRCGEMDIGLTWVATSRRFGDRSGVMFFDEHGRVVREVRDVVPGDDPFRNILV